VRIVDDCSARYPQWVPQAVTDEQFVLHPSGADWAGCLNSVGGWPTSSWILDARPGGCMCSRRCPRPGAATVVVVVLQIVHALADGTRTAELAGWLFGRDVPVPDVVPVRPGSALVRGLAAARAHRQLMADIEAGRAAAAPPPRPVLPTNTLPPGRVRVSTLVRHRRALTAGTCRGDGDGGRAGGHRHRARRTVA
jgi:hypothetical protein